MSAPGKTLGSLTLEPPPFNDGGPDMQIVRAKRRRRHQAPSSSLVQCQLPVSSSTFSFCSSSLHGCPNPGLCSGAAAVHATPSCGAGATNTNSYFDPIAEEDEEDGEAVKGEPDEHWDSVTAEAYEALDQLRDAEDELEYLEQFRSWSADLEYSQAMHLQHSRSEFEEECAERKVVRPLKSQYVDEVVKSLRNDEKYPKKVEQLLIGSRRADLPADYDRRTEQEKIDTFKNQDFGRRFERLQAQNLQAQASAAHAATAGRDSFNDLRDPKAPNPESPQGLDF